jgi:16S rRNA (guanine966-N2)-methyltransferase
MPRPKRKSSARRDRPVEGRSTPVGLRIIGGTFRGRRLRYGGDPVVRPMKDRVREAVFNLVGPSVRGKHAVDMFAGTGALALEAISRGAIGATFIECHYPTARILRDNIAVLGVQDICEVVVADTFAWLRQSPSLPTASPWVVFFSPPYDFFVGRAEDMLRLINEVYRTAPAESVLVVESDQRFDFAVLDRQEPWNIRDYPPARVGICRKPASESLLEPAQR